MPVNPPPERPDDAARLIGTLQAAIRVCAEHFDKLRMNAEEDEYYEEAARYTRIVNALNRYEAPPRHPEYGADRYQLLLTMVPAFRNWNWEAGEPPPMVLTRCDDLVGLRSLDEQVQAYARCYFDGEGFDRWVAGEDADPAKSYRILLCHVRNHLMDRVQSRIFFDALETLPPCSTAAVLVNPEARERVLAGTEDLLQLEVVIVGRYAVFVHGSRLPSPAPASVLFVQNDTVELLPAPDAWARLRALGMAS